MYASIVWAPGLPSFMWTQLERPLVTMLSRQLWGKSTVPHDIIRVEFGLPPMLVEALFQVVWLFDSLVTPSLMYASIVWAPGLPSFMWTQSERPLVTMLSRQLWGQIDSVPHDIIRAEFGLPPDVSRSTLSSGSFLFFIHRIHSQPQDRISRRAFEASRSLHASGDIVVSWLLANNIDINNLPPP